MDPSTLYILSSPGEKFYALYETRTDFFTYGTNQSMLLEPPSDGHPSETKLLMCEDATGSPSLKSRLT